MVCVSKFLDFKQIVDQNENNTIQVKTTLPLLKTLKMKNNILIYLLITFYLHGLLQIISACICFLAYSKDYIGMTYYR